MSAKRVREDILEETGDPIDRDEILERLGWVQGMVMLIAIHPDLDDDIKETADCARHHLSEACSLLEGE